MIMMVSCLCQILKEAKRYVHQYDISSQPKTKKSKIKISSFPPPGGGEKWAIVKSYRCPHSTFKTIMKHSEYFPKTHEK